MHKSSIKIVFFSSSSSSPYDYLLFLYIAAAIDHTAGHLVVRVHYKENTTPPAIRNFRSFWRRGLHSFVLCPKQRAWHFPTGDFDERACHNLVPDSTKEKEGIAFYCRNLFTTRWSAARSQKGKEDESRPTVIPFQIFAWVSCVWFGLSLRSLSARPWKKRGKKRILGVWKCTLILFILNKKEKKVSSSLPSSSPLSKDLGGNQIREHKVEEEGPAISPKEPLAAGNTQTQKTQRRWQQQGKAFKAGEGQMSLDCEGDFSFVFFFYPSELFPTGITQRKEIQQQQNIC